MSFLRVALVSALVCHTFACSNDHDARPPAAMTQKADADAGASTTPPPSDACVIADDCPDIDVAPLTSKACCTAAYSCGYELPDLDEQTLMYYPQVTDYRRELTKDDPNGRCARDTYLFSPDVGMIEQRFEQEGLPDILIASTCSSFRIGDFSFAGCCLPDDSCGLSTHSYWTILEGLAMDPNAPFSHPECVAAETLNEQLRASTLGTLARFQAGGSCNYAEIAARQPDTIK